MCMYGILRVQQKHGLVMRIPKISAPTKLADYRPITLLNTEYKTLACIIANRIRAILDEIPHPSQHCGVSGQGIFDAVATIWDAIACAELTHAPLCILSLDFREAFDRIAHWYLFRLLSVHGFNTNFITLIENIYDKALFSTHINGHTTGPIPIQCSVVQGCPMSMLLFSLSLNPLLIFLD
jgi:hypothetical protein